MRLALEPLGLGFFKVPFSLCFGSARGPRIPSFPDLVVGRGIRMPLPREQLDPSFRLAIAI